MYTSHIAGASKEPLLPTLARIQSTLTPHSPPPTAHRPPPSLAVRTHLCFVCQPTGMRRIIKEVCRCQHDGWCDALQCSVMNLVVLSRSRRKVRGSGCTICLPGGIAAPPSLCHGRSPGCNCRRACNHTHLAKQALIFGFDFFSQKRNGEMWCYTSVQHGRIVRTHGAIAM